jgi:large subunit ribosomal protein L33
MREIVFDSCGDCKQRNYVNRRNKKKHPEKLTLSKYCPFCRKHTEHKETK